MLLLGDGGGVGDGDGIDEGVVFKRKKERDTMVLMEV